MLFKDRTEAGRFLAAELTKDILTNSDPRARQPIILALPRGGVPIGVMIAQTLHAPLEVINARKIGAPHNLELGIGALAEGNIRILDKSIIKILNISKKELTGETQKAKEELSRRIALYRNNKPLVPLKGKTVILVDDGLATGVSAQAAISAIKKKHPKKLFFASPVCARDSAKALKSLVDGVICITTPVDFTAVGCWYRNFEQVTDEKVMALLGQSKIHEQSHYKFT